MSRTPWTLYKPPAATIDPQYCTHRSHTPTTTTQPPPLSYDDMGFFSSDSDEAQAYDQVVNAPHKAELSHELIAAAASYEAAKAYQEHQEREGKPQSHEKAKEILAGFAGAFVDRIVETKGLDFVDKERAKRHANDKFDNVVQPDNY
ncbi:hypothetical protein C8Q78DRAFT_1003166 [Trametes maxima]|nr:hypothetical protein C8Q78DRAFT_1003166 [Trametes maxima]